jgi:hypothetical protein
MESSAITFWLRWILISLACVDVVGAVTSIFMMIFGIHGGAAPHSLVVPI